MCFFQFNTKDLVICRYSLFFLTTLLLEVDAIPKQVAQHEDVLTKIHSKRCKAVFSNQAPLVVDGGNKSQHDAIYVTRWQSWILGPGSWDWSVGTHMYIYIWYIYVRSWFGTCPFTLHHVSHMAASNSLFCDERSLGWCISTWEHIYLHNQRVDDEKIKDAKVSIYICIYTHIYIYILLFLVNA